MIKTVLLILCTLLMFSTYSQKEEQILNRLPLMVSFHDKTPDSIKPFIKTIFQLSGFKLVGVDEVTELSKPVIAQAHEKNRDARGTPEEMLRQIQSSFYPIANAISLNFIWTDSLNNKFSLSYRLIPLPMKVLEGSPPLISVDSNTYVGLEWPYSIKKAVESIISNLLH